MNNPLPTANSIVLGHYYIVGGTTGSITYDGISYNIGEAIRGTEVSDYSVNSGDAFLTEQFRFYGSSVAIAPHRDELSFNDEFRFYGSAIGCIRQRDEFFFTDEVKFYGASLEIGAIRYYTTLKFIKS